MPDLNKNISSGIESGEEIRLQEEDTTKEEKIAEIVCYICGQTFNKETIV